MFIIYFIFITSSQKFTFIGVNFFLTLKNIKFSFIYNFCLRISINFIFDFEDL
jgi:hypothetical protein